MTIEEFAAAVQTQIAAAAGLTGDKVIWETPGHSTQASVQRPSRPFLTLRIVDDGDVELQPEEQIIDNPDPAPPIPPYPSQTPILLQTTDRPEITVRVVAFTNASRASAVSPAFLLLKQVRRKMGTELTASALDPITVLDRGNVTDASLMLETAYEGRAVLDLKFGSIEIESEGINTIETVKVEVTLNNVDDSLILQKTLTLTAPVPRPPAGTVAYFASWNLDGALNAGLVNGAEVATWKDLSGQGDALALGPAYNPHLLVSGAEPPAIAFDGVADAMNLANTQSSMAFLHTTGVFDMFVILKRLAGGYRTPLGSTLSTAEKGLYTDFDADGHLTVILCRGVGASPIVSKTTTLTIPIGAPTLLHIRGTGTQLQISKDMVTYETAPFTAPLASGNATNPFSFGYVGGVTGTSNFGGHFHEFILYAKNLNAADLVALKDYLSLKGLI